MNPYEEGYEDGRLDDWNNPYKPRTSDYYEYEEGFDDGKDQVNDDSWF